MNLSGNTVPLLLEWKSTESSGSKTTAAAGKGLAARDVPSISVLIPTLNSEKVILECLDSIRTQDYPQERIEIIIADGGSTDKTLELSKRYRVKIVSNSLKTGEAGKASALKESTGDLVALIDSDNVLIGKDWFTRMVAPFTKEENVLISEPISFNFRKEDGFIDRYCALVGVNDPLVLFLGNYDRYSLLTNKWTGLDVGYVMEKPDYLLVNLNSLLVPTMGANGTIIRKDFLDKVMVGSYLFDIDLITRAIRLGMAVKVAKVKTGIVHRYCGSSIQKFIKKQNRRIRDFSYNQKIGTRAYSWHKQKRSGIVIFIIFSITIVPTLLQAFYGYSKKPDRAWFFHPLACLVTLYVYASGTIRGLISPSEASRKGWGQ